MALLLHSAGMAVQDLFETLSDPGPPAGQEGDDDAYSTAMRKLDTHFAPKLNTPYERHVFRQMSQKTDETVDQFVARLRRQAENCEFSDKLEENVRDQVIDKCSSSLFRRKLLEKGQSLTLAIAQDLGRTMETVAIQVQRMEAGPHSVNFAKAAKRFDHEFSKPGCFRCGRSGHVAKDPSCPAKKATCRRCGFVGHYEAVCKTKQVEKQMPKQPQRYHKKKAKEVHCLWQEEDPGNPEYLFSIFEGDTGQVTVKVGGVEVDMLIDSGASCNVIDQETWEKMKK